jgi:hypothetical protein
MNFVRRISRGKKNPDKKTYQDFTGDPQGIFPKGWLCQNPSVTAVKGLCPNLFEIRNISIIKS